MKYLQVLIATAWLTACIDGTGPRPRPGTSTTEPPPANRAALVYIETLPRVVTQGRPDSIQLNVGVTGTVTSVEVQPRTGPSVVLTRVNPGLYTTRLHPNVLLFGYRTGDLHQLGAIITVSGEGGGDQESLIINVKDATVPAVGITTLAPGVQATSHVLNIRTDALNIGGEVSPDIIRTLYDHFPDDYTFIAVIEQVQSSLEPFYLGVRNNVAGLGLPQFNRGANYGSAAKLEGIVHYPDAVDFDLAETDDLHELGHRWMNYSTQPNLAVGQPHWPLSSVAAGIMGWADPQTLAWLPFPFDISRQADGTHLLTLSDQPRSFNDLELYMMGLLPPDSVQTHFVFADQSQRAQVRINGVLRGAVDSVRIADIIARDGARVPSAASAPREFRVATIVLSRNGVLSHDEMAFFDYLAARGEQRVALNYSNGLTRGTTLPFYVATGGRGTMVTLLRIATPN